MAHRSITTERDGRVMIITINRPPANAIDLVTAQELDSALTEAEQDNDIRALILTGAGEKGFSAGWDLKIAGTPDGREAGKKGHAVTNRIARFPKPVIAAINGYAHGGGLELAMACHFRIMADREGAVLGQNELEQGIIPGWGGTQRLPRLVGKTRALEIMMLGRRVSPAEAVEMGLVNRTAPPNELLDEALKDARTIARKAPLALKALLDAVNRGFAMDLESGLAVEEENYMRVIGTRDAQEARRAFVEKREPEFTGE